MGIFESRFLLGYSRIEDVMSDPATYTAPDGITSQSVTVIYNELVGALDQFGNAVFSVKTDELTAARGGVLVIDGTTEPWVIVDVRDARDGTAELRCIRPEVTA